MWLPIIYDSEVNHGVMFMCFGCGEKVNLPLPNDQRFEEFVNEKVDQKGCKICNCQDYLFKNFLGRVYDVAHKIKK